MMPVIADISDRADKTFEKFLEDGNFKTGEDNKSVVYSIPIKQAPRFNKLRSRAESFDVAFLETPRALVVSLVSAFDAYLGELLRALFYLKPDLLQGSQRPLTFRELAEFETLDRAREFILEKEIESVIRESHAKQFEWMETRFAVALRKGLHSWPTFIELTERRNLFVHRNGVVSSQYLEICKKHDVDVTGLKVGETLHVDPSYFSKAFECLYEIGVKLAHVLWRKLDEDGLDASDNALIEGGFDLLQDKEYGLTATLLDFAVNGLPRHATALNRRVLLVNLCIAHKFGGQPDKCTELLEAEDWSACDDRFRLAVTVLKDDFKQAADLMRSLGAQSKSVTRHAYETWPLFREFRQSPEFLNAFNSLFGEEFLLEDKSSDSVSEQKQATASSPSVSAAKASSDEIEPSKNAEEPNNVGDSTP
jgi:hypothetical protein